MAVDFAVAPRRKRAAAILLFEPSKPRFEDQRRSPLGVEGGSVIAYRMFRRGGLEARTA